MAKCCRIVSILLVVALATGISSAQAGWIQNGVAICTANGGQYALGLVSDGSGGAIILWQDERSGNYDIYAQRIDANGSVMWTADGAAVCAADSDQAEAKLISDGSGGAIITWHDQRSGNHDIYAQRVDANGSALWAVNGIAVCTAGGDQDYPRIASDGSGGAIITWQDERSGSAFDIYAQRVDANGTALWATDGVAICVAGLDEENPEIISDGSGGAIITWRMQEHIYAQRVDAGGTALWAADGVAVCTARVSQSSPSMISDGAGGAIITWEDFDTGGNIIYAQRVAANGSVMWTGGGLPMCTVKWGQYSPEITSDGAGGAIIAWYDMRNDNYDVYAQRVDANGAVQWTVDGAAICTAGGSQELIQLIPDVSGGAIITWYDIRTYTQGDIYAQKVGANGSTMWQVNGVAVCKAPNYQYEPWLVSDGSGGAFITWWDLRGGTNYDIYAQRVDAAGHTVVATLLQNYAVSSSEAGIALTWTLSEVDEGTEFFIERAAAPSGPFVERPSGALRRDGLSFSYIDGDWEPGTSYWFHVGYSAGGVRKILFESGPVATPAMPLTLLQNHPNPFNPSTEIRYYLPENCYVALDVYDIRGALVTRLAEGSQDKGYHSVSWAGRDRNGREMSSGVYFYRMRAGKTEISRKMVLAR